MKTFEKEVKISSHSWYYQNGKISKIKIKYFPEATIDDMQHHINPLLKHSYDNMIVHIGIDKTVNEISKVVLQAMTKLYGNFKSACKGTTKL